MHVVVAVVVSLTSFFVATTTHTADAQQQNQTSSENGGGGVVMGNIIHDAEYYIVEAQNRQKWKEQDKRVAEKLDDSTAGRRPNIIHFMWDDQPFGAVGIPAMQDYRGYSTPNLNKQAEEGVIFTRMYTEPSCTPTRSAALTGQLARRTGVYEVGFGVEYVGFPEDTTTIGDVMRCGNYTTGFFGKAHVGDMSSSYLHKRGFDEAFVSVYNQVSSVWNPIEERQNKVIGLNPSVLAKENYTMDKTFVPGWDDRWVFFYEGNVTDGKTREWCGTSRACYDAFDEEAKNRAFKFIRRAVEEDKPFYVAWWPLLMDLGSNSPNKTFESVQRGMVGEGYENFLDPAFGELMDLLEELNVKNNTLVVSMSDNGPMTHNPPPGMGMGEGVFRGGKGDFLEGGVRVSAQASWPDVIKPGSRAHDMIHVTDLYTTFAKLGDGLDCIPTDRIIDGIDQTALLVEGDSNGRRDHVFIYVGPELGASVKNQYKMHWRSSDPLQAASGITSVFELYNDPREVSPMVVEGLHFKEPFKRMRARHDLWIEKYPHAKTNKGPAFTDIENAREETRELTSNAPVDLGDLPFDVNAFMTYELPFDASGARDGM